MPASRRSLLLSRSSLIVRKFLACVRHGAATLAVMAASTSLGAEPTGRPAAPLAFPRTPPTEPAQAAATMRGRHGFRLELLAAEPLVTDPVALEYDENGRAYVVEMSDYPHVDKAADKPFAEAAGQAPIGRVRLLEDVDGDGRFDRGTLFAEGLSWPTGVACWRGGIFVAATPDIWYFRDTDGDGRADERRKVFSGFRKFNVQAVMNNLKWGLDNKLYGAGSSNGGTIRQESRPDAPAVTLGRNDFRFDPRRETLELVSGGARFGNSFDDWGNRFLCNIRNPVQHVVLPQEYLARNPHVPVRATVFDAAEAGDTLPVYRISPLEPWRALRAERMAAESGQNYPRSETNAGSFFTSSSGVTVYRGAAYPAEFRGQVFVAEVASNAIHRRTLAPRGATFLSERADENVEFLASTDNWFRPVNFSNAPDGTLHVLDMYRETIEHPWSIPDDILAALDLRSGRDRGRIYRLAPEGFRPPPPPRLGAANTAELVRTLENPHSWWRETAQRLLVERQDAAAPAALRTLLRSTRSDLAKLHAIWTLEGLGELTEDDLVAPLADTAAGLREHAVRLAEPRLAYSSKLLEPVGALADDPAIRVRFQVAFSLGEVTHPTADAALARIAQRDAADPWVRAAVMSGLKTRADRTLATLWRDSTKISGGTAALPLARELAMTIAGASKGRVVPPTTDAQDSQNTAQTNVDPVAATLQLASVPPAFVADPSDAAAWQTEVVLGLAEGLKRSGRSLSLYRGDKYPQAERLIAETLAAAGRAAADSTASLERRAQAIDVLAYDDFVRVDPLLSSLLEARHPVAVQQAAVRALAGFVRPEVPVRLLAAYRGLTPAVRADVVEALASRTDRAPALVEALEARTISLFQLSAARRNLLAKHANPDVRQRMEKLLAGATTSPRRDVVARYQESLKLTADAARGAAVYARECQNCHRLNGKGHDVGPNLETIRHRNVDELLVNILDPNREVSPSFLEYVVELADGRTPTGMIAVETATSVTLRRPQGVEDVLLRGDVERLTSTGKSLMPEGLEQKISPQELADLLAYLKSNPSK